MKGKTELFENKGGAESRRRIAAVIKEIPLLLETDPAVFSPRGIDKGTLAMLKETEFRPGDKVLDLGCGCGIVGILAAKILGEENVVLCDIALEAVRLSEKNAGLNGLRGLRILQSDGFSSVPDQDFTLILSNPPYHTNFSVAKEFIEGGYKRLLPGGKMLMVTKRLDWYKNKLTAVFGGVRVKEAEGYYVFVSEKREGKKPQGKGNKEGKGKKGGLSKKLQKKYKV